MDPEGSILLRGNTDDRVERILADSEIELSSDVLESARPLSEITSQKKFLARVNPRIILETGGHEETGKGRRYLHMNKTGSPDVPVFNAGSDGAVTIDMKNSTLSIRCYGTSKVFHLQRSASRAAGSSGL
jgi:beta-lactamase superfamily II metal-dependent hydrolase